MGKLGNQGGFGNVIVRDQSTPIIDLLFTRELVSATIKEAQGLGDDLLEIESIAVTPVVGNIVSLMHSQGTEFYQAKILTVTPQGGDDYDLEVDTPLDFAFGVGDIGAIGSADMNVDGSTTPVVFSVSPVGLLPGSEWDVTLMIFSLFGTQSMDDGKFGDLAALDKGVIIRVDNGNVKNVANVKTNGEFAESAFEREYITKAPAGKTSFIVRRTISGKENSGVVLRIEANTGDGIKVIIQDDLTSMDRFRARVQGHVKEI